MFVLGYPGGTTRYRESWSIEYARDANFPFLDAWLDARSDALRLIGADGRGEAYRVSIRHREFRQLAQGLYGGGHCG